MPQLEFETFYGQILWLAISFLMTYLFVHFVFAPKLSRNIARRDSEIKKNLETAEADIVEAKKIRADLAVMLKAVIDEVEDKQAEAELDIKNMLEKNNVEAEKLYFTSLQDEDKKLAAEYETQISKHLPEVTKELSSAIISKLLSNYSGSGNVS